MKQKFRSRTGAASLAFLLVVFLAGCDFFALLFDPLIGKWHYQQLYPYAVELLLTVEFKPDRSFTWDEIWTGPAGNRYESGTYVKDDSAKTLTLTVTLPSEARRTTTYSYAFGSNNQSLTFSGYTFTRQ